MTVGPIAAVLLLCAMLVAMCLLFIFIAVPLLRGIGQLVTFVFRGIVWIFTHIFEFIFGMIGDVLRFIGGLPVFLIFSLLAVGNIVIGRWSAAGHYADSAKRECRIGSACAYRALIRRPLKLLMLHSLLEGFEQRIPEAMAAVPGADRPSRRTGQFEGYEIVGSLPGGGSGSKLYIARPDERKQAQIGNMPQHVVIKSFALTEGSSLPQIVRESRALEVRARNLGHVFEHQMDEHRFYYVMPYHDGDHLGVITRQLHGEAGADGLQRRQLRTMMSHIHDLLVTLSAYHKGGLWHKDVKPDNVIVHDGRAHLVDLGLVTPLRSAMTLTTHGTEYFRDPEMVRQALRGVKVHQVDGAKFDIYAVGAVMYFVMENTFPAHGGLSRFAKKTPEALGWIVRRAMAEYNQRYETADAMLDDLAIVIEADDPFAVRPGELPSMRGGGVAEPQVRRVVAAGSPQPRWEPAAAGNALGNQAGDGPHVEPSKAGPFCTVQFGWGTAAMPAGADVGAAQDAPAGPSQPRRPVLRVTNWWTGAYEVQDPSTGEVHGPAAHRALREHAREQAREQAREFRRQARDLGRGARTSMSGARKAARAQIKAARSRARDMQSRAHARGARFQPGPHHRAPGRPSAFLGFLAVAVLACGAIAAIAVYKSQSPDTYSYVTVDDQGRTRTTLMIGPDHGKPALIVTSDADLDDPVIQEKLMRIARKHEAQGYDVVLQPDVDQSDIEHWVRMWRGDSRNPEADQVIEDYMEQHNVSAFVHVTGDGYKRELRDTLIWSTRDGAEQRRRSVIDAPPPAAEPYLLINDHPAKVDALVEQRIGQIVQEHRDRGWEIIVRDDAEAQVRKVLPAGPVEAGSVTSPMLHRILREQGLGGILKIDAGPGEGEPHQRVIVTRLAAEDIAAGGAIAESAASDDGAGG